jgi:hypothetical protein
MLSPLLKDLINLINIYRFNYFSLIVFKINSLYLTDRNTRGLNDTFWSSLLCLNMNQSINQIIEYIMFYFSSI